MKEKADKVTDDKKKKNTVLVIHDIKQKANVSNKHQVNHG